MFEQSGSELQHQLKTTLAEADAASTEADQQLAYLLLELWASEAAPKLGNALVEGVLIEDSAEKLRLAVARHVLSGCCDDFQGGFLSRPEGEFAALEWLPLHLLLQLDKLELLRRRLLEDLVDVELVVAQPLELEHEEAGDFVVDLPEERAVELGSVAEQIFLCEWCLYIGLAVLLQRVAVSL